MHSFLNTPWCFSNSGWEGIGRRWSVRASPVAHLGSVTWEPLMNSRSLELLLYEAFPGSALGVVKQTSQGVQVLPPLLPLTLPARGMSDSVSSWSQGFNSLWGEGET